ncbi:rhomboid family intramembrane serine protease [Candidatus Woesearchaeota archaeon]|nr:MAG: rhomboid family intramembrane serine protease [Candidatus Woesearchaeota archaeon]
MSIRSESELLWQQLKKMLYALITLPYHLIDVLIHPSKMADKVGAVHEWFKEFFRWFFESRATATIILLNVAAFAVSMTMFSEQQWERYILYPESVFNGGLVSLVTSAFLHADVWHLLGNMLALLIMGRIVEKEVGTLGFLIIYFGAMVISGIGSSLFYIFVANTNIGSIGASGAIAGVTSAAILIQPFYLTYLVAGIPLPVSVVGLAFITQDVLAVLNPLPGDNIGHIAHLAGYTATFLLVFFVAQDKRKLFKGLIVNVAIVLLALAAFQLKLVSLGTGMIP